MHVMHLEREHLATDAQLACQHPCLSLIDFLLPSSFFRPLALPVRLTSIGLQQGGIRPAGSCHHHNPYVVYESKDGEKKRQIRETPFPPEAYYEPGNSSPPQLKEPT